jgi:hypothetical protein
MSPIRRIVAARRLLLTWFGGLALSAKAGIAIAAFVTMSAGVVIGAPYTPTSAPWLTPDMAPYQTVQTPSPLEPAMVEAATPAQSVTSGSRTVARQTGTSAPSTVQPTVVVTTLDVGPTATKIATKTATTMAPATTKAAATQGRTTAVATTAPQTTSSVYYKNCAQASKSGAAPITSGQPGYRTGLDPNHNGVACE